MKRKPLKIHWEYDEIPVVPEGFKVIPNRDPDFEHMNIRYWFNEMVSFDMGHAKSATYNIGWVMDVCPRTGALMVLNPNSGTWHIQRKAVYEAYHDWLAEHFLMTK